MTQMTQTSPGPEGGLPGVSPSLRALLAADYAPVQPLASPLSRTLWLCPFGALMLVAAPMVFELRMDAARLGWLGTWGVSGLQVLAGLVWVGAALREAVPGRTWGRTAMALWLALPVAIVAGVTLGSWEASPVQLRTQWWWVGGLCFTWSAVSAWPAVALAAILAARAYPMRPAFTGALLGFGAGLMADAGWRLFCHFSEPAHVLAAHLAAVLASAAAGAVLSSGLAGRR